MQRLTKLTEQTLKNLDIIQSQYPWYNCSSNYIIKNGLIGIYPYKGNDHRLCIEVDKYLNWMCL